MGLHEQGDTERPFIRARLVAQETKKTTKMDLTDTSVTFAAPRGAMTGERKKNAQAEMVNAFFDISRAHFHSPVRRKVAIRVPQGDPSCPSGVAMLNRAKYGTKDAAQCFDLYCKRTCGEIWITAWECAIRACSDTATTLRRLQHGLTLLNSRYI